MSAGAAAVLVLLAGGSAGGDERTDCLAVIHTPPMPPALPMMPKLHMNEPMPTAMKKEGMIKGDVAKEAQAQDACMTRSMMNGQTVPSSAVPSP